MIHLLTLSPALDLTLEISDLNVGGSNRAIELHRRPGGKGVNIARILTKAGIDNNLFLPLGGETGSWIEALLLAEGQKMHVFRAIKTTRTSVAIVERVTTILNEAAPDPAEAEFKEILAALDSAPDCDVFVVSGSTPDGLDDLQFTQLLAACKSKTKHLVVDTSGSKLIVAAQAGAQLLKPNLEELLAATGLEDKESAIKFLLNAGAARILLSLGAKGSELYGPSGVSRVQVQPVEGNPTGAGDAMVAAASWALASGLPEEELLRYAVAAGKLAVMEPVAGQVQWEAITEEAAKIEIGNAL